MKSYTINYRYAIGSFLDSNGTDWSVNDGTSVTLQLENDEHFASLILEYAEWVENIEAL